MPGVYLVIRCLAYTAKLQNGYQNLMAIQRFYLEIGKMRARNNKKGLPDFTGKPFQQKTH